MCFFFKTLALFFLTSALALQAYADPDIDSLFRQLDIAISKSNQYDAQRMQRIAALKADVKTSLPDQYRVQLALYDEYKIFNFDSAFSVARKLERLAQALGDSSAFIDARIKLAYVLLSAGLFKEAFDYLTAIRVQHQPDNLKAAYYSTMGRYYYDLADYDNDTYHTPDYVKKGNVYMDSALLYFPKGSFDARYFTGLKQLKAGAYDDAFVQFQSLIDQSQLSDHQVAVVASTLSFIYNVKGQRATAIDYQIRAARADIQSATKETFAILNLAQLLFESGDFKRASRYIKKAVDDASFYGARQRKVQVSAILPIIQSSEMNEVENQRRSWVIYGAVVSCILLLFAFFSIIIYRQNRKLQHARNLLAEAHRNLRETNASLHNANAELHKVNEELLQVNTKLLEANKIKEEYVGYFFTINSALIHKIEKLKNSIEQKAMDRKVDEIRYIVNAINIKEEKNELMKGFDRAFLKLFPNFVVSFNELFPPEERIELADDELLNTELRIYALIRLGIRDNEKIATILDYSVKSIYAYKTKIRNRALYSKDEFERRVMDIQNPLS